MGTYVNLYDPIAKRKQAFVIESAQAILNLHTPGWELKDSKFIFKDGIITRSNTGKAKKQEQPAGS